MENEIMNTEMVEDVEIYDGVEETTEDSDTMSGKTIAGLVFGGVLVLAGVLLYKNREKFTEWRIKKLQKKGYVVYKPEEVEAEAEEIDDEIGSDDE